MSQREDICIELNGIAEDIDTMIENLISFDERFDELCQQIIEAVEGSSQHVDEEIQAMIYESHNKIDEVTNGLDKVKKLGQEYGAFVL